MDTTTLQRLLKYPHAAVFDKDPAGELAFLLQHPDGAAWRVADRALTASVGEDEFTYSLAAHTVETLAEALELDGFTVSHLSGQYRYLSALALVEGDGSQFVSNGDRLHVFTSILWVILSAYAAEVMVAGEQVVQALRQMVITTASGEWLDLWGTLYATPRLPGESDDAYAARIPREAFRLRVNARAIEVAIKDTTGFDVIIEEPWQELFTLDQSVLSGPDRLYDGDTVGYHLISPITHQAVDWPAVLAVIERNRAAGVLVVMPRAVHSSWVDASDGKFVHFGGESIRPGRSVYEDRALLDYSDIEEVSVPNHPLAHLRQIIRSSGVYVGGGFAVGSAFWRDYRSYQFSTVYTTQRWGALPQRTWGTPADTGWSDSTVIGTSHTRES